MTVQKRRTSRSRRRRLILAALSVLVLVAVLLFFALRHLFPVRYLATVQEYAGQNGVPPSLVMAVIHTESGFREDAVSRRQAKGLMQITDDTLYWLMSKDGDDTEYTPQQLFDPQVNIRFGTFFLGLLLDEFSEERTALAAYNAGRGNVKKWLAAPETSENGRLTVIPFGETRRYVEKVARAKLVYELLYPNINTPAKAKK